jgi:hypothetical protein
MSLKDCCCWRLVLVFSQGAAARECQGHRQRVGAGIKPLCLQQVLLLTLVACMLQGAAARECQGHRQRVGAGIKPLCL